MDGNQKIIPCGDNGGCSRVRREVTRGGGAVDISTIGPSGLGKGGGNRHKKMPDDAIGKFCGNNVRKNWHNWQEVHEKHSYKVAIDLHGNFVPKSLRGARVVPESVRDERQFWVHWKDRLNLRPLSGRTYRAVSLCSGAGIDSEAARRASFNVVYAAEVDGHLRDLYRAQFGVQCHIDNEALYQEITQDVVMCTFGTECRSVSTPGQNRGLENTEDWRTFERAVEYMERDKILCFHYENVAALWENETHREVFSYVLDRLSRQYVVRWGVVCPSAFGRGASRKRIHFLGFRKEVAEKCGFTAQGETGVIDKPFSNVVCVGKCISDFIEDRRAEIEPDQIDLDLWMERRATSGDPWEIVWAEGYSTESARALITRKEGCEGMRPITLGYVKKKSWGPSFPTTTGFKIGHIYGLLHGITHNSMSEEAQGPGRNTCFYWDPLTQRTRTLSEKTIRRIWDVESWPDLSVKEMGRSAHPAGTQANLFWMALFLDKLYAQSSSIPPVPRIEFNSISDIFTEETLVRIGAWEKCVVQFVIKCRSIIAVGEVQLKLAAPAPLVIDDGGLQFHARGWHFDLKKKKPERVCRRLVNSSTIRLEKLWGMLRYDDPDVVTATNIGSNTGANPVRRTVVYPNDCGFVKDEDIAHKQFAIEEERGWLTRHRSIPFSPFVGSPFFMLDQGTKVRRIFNVSKEGKESKMSINSSRVWNEKAKLELVQHEWIVRAIGELTHKAHYLIERGYECIVVLYVVDLFSAYNQVSVDAADQWQTCATVVNSKEEFEYLAINRTSFGPENAPMIFTRISRALCYSCDQLLRAAEDYQLQEVYRRMRHEDSEQGVAVRNDDREPEFKHAFATRQQKKQRLKAKTTKQWGNLDKTEGLVADDPVVYPGPSVCSEEGVNLYKNACYLDDSFGGFVVPVKAVGKMAFDGGKTTSNVEYARRKFALRKHVELPPVTAMSGGDARRNQLRGHGPANGERLREKYIRRPMEEAGCIVVCDEKSQKKYDDGACNTVMTILGCVYDVSDLANPTIALTPTTRSRLVELLANIMVRDNRFRVHPSDDIKLVTMVPLKQWESLVGKLNNASKVARSCKVYLCGLYAAMRSLGEGDLVPVTPWARRNILWWQRFLDASKQARRLFRSAQATEKKHCPHTDASTGWGFGGFWIKADTCFYIQGEWNEAEKELIANENLVFADGDGVSRRMGINFLEMATVGMLLDVAEGDFERPEFTFYCDNEATVKILTSYKTRTLPLATLLESIDINIAQHNLSIDFEWIATENNVESDWLSRGETEAFYAYVKRTYDIHKFVQLQVPDSSRDLEKAVRTAREHPSWIVADGECESEEDRGEEQEA